MDRDRQILDAAAALFYDRGFHAVGVDDIGKAVGISGPALYKHFGGKGDILAALLTEALDELMGATAVVYDEPDRDLDRLIDHHIRFALEQRHLVNVYQREARYLPEESKRLFGRRTKQYAKRWEEALARRFPDAGAAEVRAGTQAAIGLIHSVAYWPPAARRGSDVVRLLHDMVLRALSTLDRPSARAA